MTTYRTLPLVSELEADGEVINCVPDSGIACCIGAGAAIANPTAAGESIRFAAGYPDAGGTTIERIAPALTHAYGVAIEVVSSYAALVAALTPGHSAFVIGNPHATPDPGPFRRFFPGFDGLHCVAVEDGSRGLWLVDPRAAAGSGYDGEAITWPELEAFWNGAGANARAGVVKLAAVPTVYPTKAVTCGPAPMRSSPLDNAGVVLLVGIGQAVEILGTVSGDTWSISGCGAVRTGHAWYHARRNGVAGYMAVGRFG